LSQKTSSPPFILKLSSYRLCKVFNGNDVVSCPSAVLHLTIARIESSQAIIAHNKQPNVTNIDHTKHCTHNFNYQNSSSAYNKSLYRVGLGGNVKFIQIYHMNHHKFTPSTCGGHHQTSNHQSLLQLTINPTSTATKPHVSCSRDCTLRDNI